MVWKWGLAQSSEGGLLLLLLLLLHHQCLRDCILQQLWMFGSRRLRGTAAGQCTASTGELTLCRRCCWTVDGDGGYIVGLVHDSGQVATADDGA